MNNVKILEIRDHHTFMPMMAVEILGLRGYSPQENYLLRRAGYAIDERYIWLTGMAGGVERGTSDPYEWGDRTRKTAHDYIIKNWDKIAPGEVIDVEFILGESTQPKRSERELE